MSALAALLEGFRHVEVTRYTQMASTTIILYDHFLTLDGEVEHVWKARWSAGKVMFILNRYYTMASVIFNNYGFFGRGMSDGFCRIFLNWQGWTGLLACILAEIILQMRLYAMYSLNKTVLVVLLVAFSSSIAASAWVMQSVLAKITAKSVRLPDGTTFCMPIGLSDHFYAFWIPMLVFECLLCGLAIARAVNTFRFGKGSSNWGSARRLIIVLFRDSVAYFLVICATYLTCLLTWALAPATLLEVPVTFSVAMSCVLANRIILNVRELSVVEPALSQHSRGTVQHLRWESGMRSQHNTQTGSRPYGHHVSNVSFAENGLKQYEMDLLRGLKATPSMKVKTGVHMTRGR